MFGDSKTMIIPYDMLSKKVLESKKLAISYDAITNSSTIVELDSESKIKRDL